MNERVQIDRSEKRSGKALQGGIDSILRKRIVGEPSPDASKSSNIIIVYEQIDSNSNH
jgi:hypothetical protein